MHQGMTRFVNEAGVLEDKRAEDVAKPATAVLVLLTLALSPQVGGCACARGVLRRDVSGIKHCYRDVEGHVLVLDEVVDKEAHQLRAPAFGVGALTKTRKPDFLMRCTKV
jgi:hypothetical protein